MEDQVILLRRRGVNYYTDYAEKYLDQAFRKRGLRLTLRQENRVAVCSLQYDRKPDLILRSPLLQTLSLPETEEMVRWLGEAFNTVVSTAPASLYPLPANTQGVIEYGLTTGIGAFDEAPYLLQAEPFIGWCDPPAFCLNDGLRKTVSFQNFGGISQGLSVCLTMPIRYTCTDMSVEVQDWRHFRNRYLPVDIFISRTQPELQTGGEMQMLRWEFPALELPEGVNLFSRKLLGPHKVEMDRARRVRIVFHLDGPDEIYKDVTLMATAWGGNTVELQFENELPLWAQQPQPAPAYDPYAWGAYVQNYAPEQAAQYDYAQNYAPEQTAQNDMPEQDIQYDYAQEYDPDPYAYPFDTGAAEPQQTEEPPQAATEEDAPAQSPEEAAEKE